MRSEGREERCWMEGCDVRGLSEGSVSVVEGSRVEERGQADELATCNSQRVFAHRKWVSVLEIGVSWWRQQKHNLGCNRMTMDQSAMSEHWNRGACWIVGALKAMLRK
jgi:hypothetical protein